MKPAYILMAWLKASCTSCGADAVGYRVLKIDISLRKAMFSPEKSCRAANSCSCSGLLARVNSSASMVYRRSTIHSLLFSNGDFSPRVEPDVSVRAKGDCGGVMVRGEGGGEGSFCLIET